jgi:hypothetical protein
MMELGASERLLFAGFANLQSDALPMSIRGANRLALKPVFVPTLPARVRP